MLKETVLQATTEVDLETSSVEDFIRIGIAAEEGAITLYNRLADEIEKRGNQVVANVFRDVALEEKVHIGEFTSLLNAEDNENEEAQKEGEEEAEDLSSTPSSQKKEKIKRFLDTFLIKENK